MKKPSRDKGQSLVEVALMLPFLTMLMLGLLDFGRAYYAVVALRDAADEGATYASIDPTNTVEIRRRAAASTPALVTVSEDNVVVDSPPVIAGGQPITVTTRVELELYTPFAQSFVLGGPLILQGQSVHPILRTP